MSCMQQRTTSSSSSSGPPWLSSTAAAGPTPAGDTWHLMPCNCHSQQGCSCSLCFVCNCLSLVIHLIVFVNDRLTCKHTSAGKLKGCMCLWVAVNRLPSVVSAAWQLHAGRQRLKAADVPGTLSPVLTQMRVVQEAAAHLDQVAAR